jgi:hypothetical protein
METFSQKTTQKMLFGINTSMSKSVELNFNLKDAANVWAVFNKRRIGPIGDLWRPMQ